MLCTLQLMTIQTMLTMSQALYPSFDIEFGVSACELKGAATVYALTIAVMMSIFSDIPLA